MRVERPVLSGNVDHPLMGQARFSAQEVRGDPDGQVADTIQIMGKLVNEDTNAPAVLNDAQSCMGPDELSTVANVWALTQQKIQFLRDESTAQPLSHVLKMDDVVEVLIRPRDIAGPRYMSIGDCDDYSMYAACLLACLGIPCCFVTVAGDDNHPGRFTHVYVAAYPKGGDGNRVRIALDASHGPEIGWEVLKLKPWVRKQEWAVNGDVEQECSGGLGGLLTAGLFVAGGWLAWQLCKGRSLLGV